MAIEKGSTIVRKAGPVETTVGTEVVLMTLDTGECLGLGETGSAVWRLLEQPIKLEDLVAKLSVEYAAPPGVIEQDVVELLEEMLARGLVSCSS